MVSFTIFAGGYTNFIASYLFNSNNSSLSLLQQFPTGPNPSWITAHPTNPNVLYAVNEVQSGALQSFDISSTGVLSNPVDTVSSGGDSPAHVVPLSDGEVAIMNYSGGNGRIIATAGSPERFDPSAAVITFPPPVGGVSHPHMTLQHGDEVFVPDLGGDKIWRLVRNGAPGNWKIQGSIAQPQGSGPRHLAIHGNSLFTLHELASTLTVQAIPPAPNGTSPIIDSVSIIPPNPPAGALWAAGEILIPQPTAKFPVPYIYVSNRNTGVQAPQGDSIAIFEHVPATVKTRESLKLVTQVFTGLDQVRGMEFGPASVGGEEFLVASGVAGTGGVVIYRRTDGGRNLVEVARNSDIPTRTSFVWSTLVPAY